MIKDTFDLGRVERYLERHPDCNVIIISNNKSLSQDYWEQIQQHVGIKKRPFFVTNNKYSLDGLPFHGALVLKVGRWWENRNASEFMRHTPLAQFSLPITFIPPIMKGGEENQNE